MNITERIERRRKRQAAKYAAINAGVKTWKVKGIEYGHCHVCQETCSTGDDAAYPLERCADCDRVVCYEHREYISNAPICLPCVKERRMDDAEKYVRMIRNARKKIFAAAYLKHLVSGAPKPDSREFGMSPMGAQAVWMSLDEIIGER